MNSVLFTNSVAGTAVSVTTKAAASVSPAWALCGGITLPQALALVVAVAAVVTLVLLLKALLSYCFSQRADSSSTAAPAKPQAPSSSSGFSSPLQLVDSDQKSPASVSPLSTSKLSDKNNVSCDDDSNRSRDPEKSIRDAAIDDPSSISCSTANASACDDDGAGIGAGCWPKTGASSSVPSKASTASSSCSAPTQHKPITAVQCSFTLPNGSSYIGMVDSNNPPQPDGTGTWTSKDKRQVYDGQCKNGKRHGFGILTCHDGLARKFAGHWEHGVFANKTPGQKPGQKIDYADGVIFVGTVVGRRPSTGTKTFPLGHKTFGHVDCCSRNWLMPLGNDAQVIVRYRNGVTFTGQVDEQDLLPSEGSLTFPDGPTLEIKNGKGLRHPPLQCTVEWALGEKPVKRKRSSAVLQ